MEALYMSVVNFFAVIGVVATIVGVAALFSAKDDYEKVQRGEA